jgi:hypothetical protein
VIVGDGEGFAIESAITKALPSAGQRALGFFVVHIGDRTYGVRAPDASMLACSLDAVNDCRRRRGTHCVPFLSEIDAALIAEAFLDANYRETDRLDYFGTPMAEFAEALHANAIVWAPDGDEAFDDGSFILHFDIGSRVRLIAFTNAASNDDMLKTVSERWLEADIFYGILARWSGLFLEEWKSKLGHVSAVSLEG